MNKWRIDRRASIFSRSIFNFYLVSSSCALLLQYKEGIDGGNLHMVGHPLLQSASAGGAVFTDELFMYTDLSDDILSLLVNLLRQHIAELVHLQ